MTSKEQREKAAEKYANSIAQNDERKTYCKEDFIAGAEWMKEQLEKNRLEHCDNITEEQYNLEWDFIIEQVEKYKRLPTILDAIEYGMKKATDKACEWLNNFYNEDRHCFLVKEDIEAFERAMMEE